MAKFSYIGANVEVNIDSFASFISKVNWIIDDMGKTVVTAAPVAEANTTNGSVTVGNAHIQGIFSANVSVAQELRGGNFQTINSIALSSNVVPKSQNTVVSIGLTSNRIHNINSTNVNTLNLYANVGTIITGNVVTLTSNDATITTGEVVTLTSNVATITTGNVVTLTSNNATIITGNVVTLTSNNATIATGNVNNLTANVATIANVNIASGNAILQNMTSANAVVANAQITVARITTANVTNQTVTGTIAANNLTATNAVITTANVANGNVTTLTSNNATITTGNVVTLSSNNATVTTGNIANLSSANATMTVAKITTANVTTMSANTVIAGNATITNANVTNATVTTGNITNLSSANTTIAKLILTANSEAQNLIIRGNLQVDGTTALSSSEALSVNTSIVQNFTSTLMADLNGNTNIGDAVTDSLTITARIDSDVLPYANNTYDLGSTTNRWAEAYVSNLYVANVASDIVFLANTTFGNATTDAVVFTARVNSDIVPFANNTFDLGSATNRFDNAYISKIDNEVFVDEKITVTSKTAASGYSALRAGTVDRSGLLEFRNGDGLRAGYLGFANNNVINITGENSHVWNANALTIAGNTVWHAGNDGSGSTLDADLLDGQHGAYYRDLTNSTGTLPNARLSGAYNGFTLSTVDIEVTGSTWSFSTPVNAGMRISGIAPNIQFRDTSGTLGVIAGVNTDAFHFYRSTTDGLLDGSSVFVIPMTGTGNMTFNSDIVWTAGNDGASSGLDSDLLDGQHGTYYRDLSNSTGTLPNARLSGAYSGISTLGLTGPLTITSSAPTLILSDSTSGSYNGRLRVDSNNLYVDTSTDDVSYAEVFRFELDTKAGYANGSRLWTDAYATTAKINGIIGYTPVTPARTITAGNGLSGGGNLGADRTITLGTPGTITNSTTNSVSATSHTHALTLVSGDITGALGFTPVTNARQVIAGTGISGGGALTADRTLTLDLGQVPAATQTSITGLGRVLVTNDSTAQYRLSEGAFKAAFNFGSMADINQSDRAITANLGLVGGGDLSANRNISLGTPSNITNSTTNSVTSTSHTHALGFTAAEVYTGTSVSATVFPIGHHIICYADDVSNRNASALPSIHSASTNRYVDIDNVSAGAAVGGTWRARGKVGNEMLLQRTA